MSTEVLERELNDLRKRVTELEAKVAAQPDQVWRQIVGTSQGDALDQEAARLGAEWRAMENKRR